MDMNQFRKSLASKRHITEASSKPGELIDTALDNLSRAIDALFTHASSSGVSSEANQAARDLANDLALRYDQIKIKASKNLKKL